MPRAFNKNARRRVREPEFSYEERVECIELQHSGYYDQCMCGHEFADDYDFEDDEPIWDSLYEQEDSW